MIITNFDANYIKHDSINYCSKLKEYTISKNVLTNNFATNKHNSKELQKFKRDYIEKKYSSNVVKNCFMRIDDVCT